MLWQRCFNIRANETDQLDWLEVQWQKESVSKEVDWLVLPLWWPMRGYVLSVYSWIFIQPYPSTPPSPPTSCCLMCPKLFINLHNLGWSAFQMAFLVLTLYGNKGETHLLIRLSLCVGLCVCQRQTNRDRWKTYCGKEMGDGIREN